MIIDAAALDFQALGRQVRACTDDELIIENCRGQRFIAAGRSTGTVTLRGTAGNALGAYLDGATLVVQGNAQDATGDTMNAGEIIVHGSAGDAPGYAMRGGRILIQGNAGYRAGIHMKAYKERVPVMVIGGRAGSFLGEYQAGGRIVVLGLGEEGPIVGNFCGTGMHGGVMYLRTKVLPPQLPAQVSAHVATDEDKEVIKGDIEAYCAHFGGDAGAMLADDYYVLLPDTKNPYKRHYVHN
ncbi:MAG: glutamate synthase [Oscillospiraceae bacterium]|jgi:glutamate synthase domain-containing protein 3|nr:glutamate synthase [Oscillospiraceae bacterium]